MQREDAPGLELMTAAAIRAHEAAQMAAGQVEGARLMARAGRGAFEAALEAWPAHLRPGQRALVLAGPGNNGGDGFVIARHLRDWGMDVEVGLLGPAERVNGDAAGAMAGYLARPGARIVPLDRLLAAGGAAGAGGVCLVVDALFGTGLSRPLAGGKLEGAIGLAEAVRERGGRVLAVDVPSGLCADSGRVLSAFGRAVRADLTVTFHRARPGHFLAEGPAHCGALELVDIGLAPGPASARLVGAPAPALLEKGGGHKYAHGHVVVLAGGLRMGGAARMAARAALRVGAGLVTLAPPRAALAFHAGRSDALLLRPVDDGTDLQALLDDRRVRALCLGPGLGLDPRGERCLEAALAARRPMVLDADALTLLARRPERLAALPGGAVLTPHDGEFARLFPDLAARLAEPPVRGPAFGRLDAARLAAERIGAVVVLKGPDTVIAAPGRAPAIHAAAYDRAVPWLATAGAGDVLAGLIAGLLGRGLPPAIAAEAAAWLHVESARLCGPGLIAEELPDRLPAVLAALGLGRARGRWDPARIRRPWP